MFAYTLYVITVSWCMCVRLFVFKYWCKQTFTNTLLNMRKHRLRTMTMTRRNTQFCLHKKSTQLLVGGGWRWWQDWIANRLWKGMQPFTGFYALLILQSDSRLLVFELPFRVCFSVYVECVWATVKILVEYTTGWIRLGSDAALGAKPLNMFNFNPMDYIRYVF